MLHFCFPTCISSYFFSFLTSCPSISWGPESLNMSEQLNCCLSTTATNINSFLNGPLQSYRTTTGKVLIFHLELPCSGHPFLSTKKRETHQIQLLVQWLLCTPQNCLTSQSPRVEMQNKPFGGIKGRIRWNTGREKWQPATELTCSLICPNAHSFFFVEILWTHTWYVSKEQIMAEYS